MFHLPSRRRLAVLAVGSVTLCALGVGAGCSTATQYRLNPTPNVDTAAFTKDMVSNRLAITIDTNLRQLNEDMGRLWLLDRPTRLTRHIVPY